MLASCSTGLGYGYQRQKDRGDAALMRYAFYTRKSIEEGLEQEFNSLDTQRGKKRGRD